MIMYGVSIDMDYPFGEPKGVLDGEVNCVVYIKSSLISFLNFEEDKTWLYMMCFNGF